MNSTLLRGSFTSSKMMENILDGYSRMMGVDARSHQMAESMNSNFNNNNSSESYDDMKDFGNRDIPNYEAIKEEGHFVDENQATDKTSGETDENIEKMLNKKSFTCEHCGGLFTDPSNLQRHIRQKHIGARAHLCGDCGKTFATSSGLKQHRHTHSTYKPFTCPVCKKSYTQFSNLCRHKRMHADCRTRIKCDNCDEYFPSSSALNKHRRFCGATSNGTVNGSNLIDSRRHNEIPNADNAPPRFFDNSGASLYNYPFNSSANDLDRIGESARHLASLLFPHPYINNDLAALEKNRINSLLFPYTPGSMNSREIDSTMSSPKKVNAQTQCDDPENDIEKLSLEILHGKSQYRIILSNPNRFKRVERFVAYAPSSRHCGIQAEIPTPVETSPNRFGHCAEPKMPGGLYNPGRRFSADSGFSPLPYAMSHNSLSPRSKSDDESNTNNFNPMISNNVKQFLDQIMAKQRLFQWASTLASAPNSHRNESTLPYAPFFPLLPKFMEENDKPLDLSKNHCANKPDEINSIEKSLELEIKNGALGRRSLLSDKAFAQPRNLQYPASSMTKNLFNNSLLSKDEVKSSENHAYLKFSPNFASKKMEAPRARYAPYSFLNHQSHGMKLYGAQNGVASQHFPFPAISPRQVISMLNTPRSIYDIMRGDIPASVRAPVPPGSTSLRSDEQHHHNLHAPYAQRFVNHKLYGQCERERYVCKYCGKQFPRSANLTRHLRTHTGEQPYSCKFCDRCFSISSNLQRHVRNIHKKERPYTCQFCNKAFGQQTNLERHLRKHRLDGKAKMNPFSAEYYTPQTESKSSVNYASPNFMNSREKKDLELSPPNSIEDRNSSLSERHTSSDDESLDASFPTSTSSPERQSESMLKENTDDDDDDIINIVSTE